MQVGLNIYLLLVTEIVFVEHVPLDVDDRSRTAKCGDCHLIHDAMFSIRKGLEVSVICCFFHSVHIDLSSFACHGLNFLAATDCSRFSILCYSNYHFLTCMRVHMDGGSGHERHCADHRLS